MKRLLKNMCYLLNKRLQKKFEEKSKEEIKEETEEIKEKEIESKTAVKEETKEEEEKTKKPVTILDFIKQIEVKERSKSEEDKIKQEIKIPKKPIKIIVDVREKNMAKLLHNYANIELKTLEVGDYVLSDRVVVERKTAEDFVNSIIDKRLFSQLKNLKKVEKPLLIVEGENFSRLHENALKGAILSIILDFGIPIIFTKNAEETADLLIKIAEKEQIKEKRTVMVRYGSIS